MAEYSESRGERGGGGRRLAGMLVAGNCLEKMQMATRFRRQQKNEEILPTVFEVSETAYSIPFRFARMFRCYQPRRTNQIRLKALLSQDVGAELCHSPHPRPPQSSAGLCVEKGESRISAHYRVGSFLVSLLQAGIWALARWRGDAHKRVC